MFFGCPRQNMNHSSENLKVIYTKCSMFYAIVNYQFKTSELTNDSEANSSSLIRKDWECAFLHNLWNYIPSRCSLKIWCGPWKVLEKWLKCFVWTPIIQPAMQTMSGRECTYIYLCKPRLHWYEPNWKRSVTLLTLWWQPVSSEKNTFFTNSSSIDWFLAN